MRGREAFVGDSPGAVAKPSSGDEILGQAWAFLRIPLALVFIELVYWWATDTSNSMEPLQVTVAHLWTWLSNVIWPGSAEMFTHTTGAFTGVQLNNPTFEQGLVRTYVSDECIAIHEIVFLGTLMLLTPGVDRNLRIRSIAAMVGIVQCINLVRLLLLYPFAVSGCELRPGQIGCEAPMNTFHNLILTHGFLLMLVGIWLGWFVWLKSSGRIGSTRVDLSELGSLRRIRLRESLPTGSVIVLIICLLLASWATWAYAMNDENQMLKAMSEDCEWGDDGWRDSDNQSCYYEMARWDEVAGRSMRAWLFAGIFAGLAIITIPEKEAPEGQSISSSDDKSDASDGQSITQTIIIQDSVVMGDIGISESNEEE